MSVLDFATGQKICRTCFEAVAEHLPKIEEKDRFNLLFGATAYPAASCQHTAQQCRLLADVTDGTLDACLAYAESHLEMQMQASHAMDALYGEDRQAVPASQRYTADFLLGLLENVPIPEQDPSSECSDTVFECPNGWKVVIFYDCGELDYIDHFVNPAGQKVDIWKWPESEDQQRLINWRGHAKPEETAVRS